MRHDGESADDNDGENDQEDQQSVGSAALRGRVVPAGVLLGWRRGRGWSRRRRRLRRRGPTACGRGDLLFVALLLQVSSRIRAFAIGLIFLLFWPAPAYASLGVMSLYGQFVMQPTTATVTDSDPPREGGPAPVTFAFDDGRSERGVSLLSERFGSTREYFAPREGSTVDVLRDPNGWLPPRTTHEGEGSGGGTVRALLLALPGVLGMVGVAAAASSALTRRESFIMVAGRPEPAPEARPQVATDRR